MPGKSDAVTKAMNVLLTLCVVAVTITLMHREFSGPKPPELRRAIEDGAQYQVRGHRRGPESAAVTIVEFSDLQCPYCKKLHSTLQQVRDKYPTQVAVLFRHFPLEQHPAALPGAIAAECVRLQGPFERFVDAAFAQQESLTVQKLEPLAKGAGVRDMAAFRRCASAPVSRLAVDEDIAAGKKLGITGTPVMVIGNESFVGAVPFDSLDKWIAAKLRGSSKE